MQAFGQRFGQAVCQRLEHDGAVVVVRGFKGSGAFVSANACGDGEHAHMVWSRALRCDEIGQATAGAHDAFDPVFFGLLTQAAPGHGDMAARFVGIQRDVVVVHAVGRVQAQHGVGRHPAAFDDFLQHGLAVGQHLAGLLTHDLVIQDGGVRPGQIPGLKERAPVDVLCDFGQVVVLEHAATNELGRGRHALGPVDWRFVGAGLRQRPHRGLFFVGVLLSHLGVVGVQFADVFGRLI